jgi:ribosomal-protein-alanine N-acetyltransferase
MQNSTEKRASARVDAELAIHLEEFDHRHIDEVVHIESTFTAPWTREMFLQELRQRQELAYGLVALIEARVVGYALNWFVADEVHVVNLAVHPHWRRRGLARQLLREVFDCARRRGMVIATLEVRSHNRPAIELYQSIGFREVALRKKYYADNGEDALVMLADLPQD